MKPDLIYLDHAASTPLAPAVLDAMLPYLKEEYGNPQSLHRAGQRTRIAIREAAKQVAAALNCDAEQVIFTAGGSMANNLALHAAAGYLGKQSKVFTTPIEHSSVLAPIQAYFADILYADVDPYGYLTSLPDANTPFACIQYANNELGTVQDMKKIAVHCKANGILLHSDAVTAFSQIPIDLKATPIDLLSLSAHKFGGPQGVGALIVKDKRILSPLILGNNKHSPIAGTPNVAGIVGMGKAAELAAKQIKENMRMQYHLRERFLQRLEQNLSDFAVLTPIFHAVPNILSLSIPGIDSEGLLALLDLYGVCASAGSACHAGEKASSHVLKAVGIPENQAKNVIRLSFGAQNTEDEVLKAAGILADAVKRLKSIQ